MELTMKLFACASLFVLLLSGAAAEAQSYGPPTYSVGDTWTLKEGRSTRQATVLRADEEGYTIKGIWVGCATCLVRMDKNLMWIELLDAAGKPVDVTQYPAVPIGQAWRIFEFPLEAGKTWRVSPMIYIRGAPARFTMDFKVEGYEKVKVAAGTFEAYKIRAAVQITAPEWSNAYQNVYWFSPQAKSTVKFTTTRARGDDYELAAYEVK